MAIPKTVTRAVILKGRGVRLELVAAGTITPGHLIAVDSNGKYAVHGTAKGAAAPIFADIRDYEGKGIDDNYSANDFVQGEIVTSGAEVNALVAASASAIAKGDLLESAGDGTLRKRTADSQSGTTPFAVTVGGVAIAVALEAVDNSAGATPVRIRALII